MFYGDESVPSPNIRTITIIDVMVDAELQDSTALQIQHITGRRWCGIHCTLLQLISGQLDLVVQVQNPTRL